MSVKTRRADANFVMTSPLGNLKIAMFNGVLSGICYSRARQKPGCLSGRAARGIERQLRRYFDDPRRPFDLKLALCGTPYQHRVWKFLTRIPTGSVLTYGEVAQHLDSGARAVGGACRNNPVPIVIPCHRVVAAGAIGGYCGNMKGRMLRTKCWLLRHEGVFE